MTQTAQSAGAQSQHKDQVTVNGIDVPLNDHTPIGRQVLTAGRFSPVDEYILVQRLEDGTLEEIGLDEQARLTAHAGEFFAWKADRVFYFVLDDRRYPWTDSIAEHMLRYLGEVPTNKSIWLERKDVADEEVSQDTVVRLDGAGVEHFYSKARQWVLDVQGVKIKSDEPTIVVRDALAKANIDLTQHWTIVLKVQGKEPQQMELDSVVDLTTPGIERLRLFPKQIDNGEAPVALRRDFQLLPKDAAYLDCRGYKWEAIGEGRRWLVIRDYPLPVGYTAAHTDLAIEIPSMYPMAEIDMFYCYPDAALVNGATIDRTESREHVQGISFQRWSRHRPPNTWSPEKDSVITHLALVEESLLREVKS